MRLLKRGSTGSISFTKDLSEDELSLYKYAILSHTWGSDEEEVTYHDITEGIGTSKPGVGSAKIRFCIEQTRQDDLEYFWMDTCCIDKRDRNELGKAINMMFDYYRNSAVCYVYLSGIGPDSTDITDDRWFTRGWTLQELIAPKKLQFYAGHRFLGDRSAYHEQIKAACGIDLAIPLKATSISQRYKWSLNRRTREPEDQHYCLIGRQAILH